MDFSTQETIFSDPQWFFRERKDLVLNTIATTVRGIMLDNKDFFNQAEIDEELIKKFLASNKNVMQIVEIPTYLHMQPKSFLLPSFVATIIGRFVKDSSF